MIESLNPMPLANEHMFHLIHAFITLTPCMSYETTFRTQFVHPLIPTLNSSPSAIIQLNHKSRNNWQPWI